MQGSVKKADPGHARGRSSKGRIKSEAEWEFRYSWPWPAHLVTLRVFRSLRLINITDALLLVTFLFLTACLPRPDYNQGSGFYTTRSQAASDHWESLRPIFRQAVEEHANLMDAGLAVFSPDGRVLFADFPGEYSETDVIPIASATKWITAAVALRMVEKGYLRLDSKASDFLRDEKGRPWSGEAGKITLEQALSFQTGFPRSHSCTRDLDYTFMECANAIYNDGLEHSPGSGFSYGNTHLHVAIAMVIQSDSERDWNQIFQEEFKAFFKADPRTRYYTKTWPAPRQGDNPLVAGGLHISFLDYSRFLEMLANGGSYRGQRYVSNSSVSSLLQDRIETGDKIYFSATQRYDLVYHYALGNWVEGQRGPGALRNSSPGLFGFYPWIVRDEEGKTRYYAIFGGYHGIRGTGKAFKILERIRPEIESRF